MLTVYLLIFDEVLPSSSTFTNWQFLETLQLTAIYILYSLILNIHLELLLTKNMSRHEPKDKHKNVQSSTIRNIQLKSPPTEWISYNLFIKWSNYTATKTKELLLLYYCNGWRSHTERWKKPRPKEYILYDSFHTRFRTGKTIDGKRQNSDYL